MRKRYLRRLRADMADAANLGIVRSSLYGTFAVRCWLDDDRPDVRSAFLDALARAERKAGIPVYGLLLRTSDDPDDIDTSTSVWRVRDRAFLGETRFEEAHKLVTADLGMVAPV